MVCFVVLANLFICDQDTMHTIHVMATDSYKTHTLPFMTSPPVGACYSDEICVTTSEFRFTCSVCSFAGLITQVELGTRRSSLFVNGDSAMGRTGPKAKQSHGQKCICRDPLL